tara:strand:+ start:2402 stop:2773 length:372 start_codon:yes stop_codon:yes gene_type:complete
MLSNHSVKSIESSIAYINTTMSTCDKDSKKREFFLNDLRKLHSQLKEAKSRVIIGFDKKDNAKVYITTSPYNGYLAIYVEEKPSGWYAERFNIEAGKTREVVYDGVQGWFGNLEFTVTFKTAQ